MSTDKTDSPAAAMLVMKTMAGTTWRMFVPTIGLTLLGLWLDNVIGMKPWLTFGGIALGAVIAAMLVWLQIVTIKRQEPNHD